MFENTILLSLKRKYKGDEEMDFVLRKLIDAQFKNGELLSEISELKYELKQKKVMVKEVIKYVAFEGGSKTKKQWLKDDLIAEYDRVAKIKHSKLNDAEKSLIEYRNKYYSLLQKI